MRSSSARLLVTVALLAAAALLPHAARADAILVKMATIAPQGSVWQQVLEEMAAEWKKASGGAVTVRLFFGGVAGDDTDVVRKLRLGTLNAALLGSNGLTDLSRDVVTLQVPLAFANYRELDCVLEKISPRLEAQFVENGLVLLGWTDGGFVRFFTKTPVRTPDDLRKLKLFSWAGDDRYVELWKRAGFNPVPLPSTEISTALQTGLVTAVTTTPQAAVLLQWFQHAKNMTDLDWAVLLGGIVISKATWDKIPPELRPTLQESARKAARRIRDVVREGTPRDVAAMQQKGLNVVKLDDAARAEWKRLVDDVFPKVRDRFASAEAFDAALRLRDACRADEAPSGSR